MLCINEELLLAVVPVVPVLYISVSVSHTMLCNELLLLLVPVVPVL